MLGPCSAGAVRWAIANVLRPGDVLHLLSVVRPMGLFPRCPLSLLGWFPRCPRGTLSFLGWFPMCPRGTLALLGLSPRCPRDTLTFLGLFPRCPHCTLTLWVHFGLIPRCRPCRPSPPATSACRAGSRTLQRFIPASLFAHSLPVSHLEPSLSLKPLRGSHSSPFHPNMSSYFEARSAGAHYRAQLSTSVALQPSLTCKNTSQSCLS